ncbi:MAG: PrsW family intramembrane metalloprotease [Lachnospiraceae bacterium]|nr:PrsW family intramembrane metalloprotease [Lachnospiraceae bacterium]
MLFALALIPVVGLLLFIYFKDKKEKEPAGLLIGLFFAGLGSVIPAIILEAIGELILESAIPYESALKGVLLAMIIVGPAEELGKYTVLRLITWKNKHFDYSYDAIVYAVFVSLGFAAIENIGYVFSGGLSTALMRMFTAIPGHTSFAVFMGYFYSKAKYASITNNVSDYKKYNALSMILPIIIHGLYDAIVMGGLASEADLVIGLAVLLWIVYVIALFVVSFIMVIKASKNDYCIVTLPGASQTVYRPVYLGNWTCSCGTVNQLNFCARCGNQRPLVESWTCPVCGAVSAFNFCGRCGCPKPQAGPQMMPQQPGQMPQQPVPQHMSSQQAYQQPVPQHMSSRQTYQQPAPQQMPPQQPGQMPQPAQPQAPQQMYVKPELQQIPPQQPGEMPPRGML